MSAIKFDNRIGKMRWTHASGRPRVTGGTSPGDPALS